MSDNGAMSPPTDLTSTALHLTTEQIEAGFDHVLRSPVDVGTLAMVVRRPAVDEREVLEVAQLDPAFGVVGDTWIERGSRRTDDGSSHPDMQLNVMNIRYAELLAGSRDRVPLAGDQLYVDLDITMANLPAWTKLAIGSAVIEVTDQPHTGCAKFTQRFGLDAFRFTNSDRGLELRLRGLNARVVSAGEVHPGDQITKV